MDWGAGEHDRSPLFDVTLMNELKLQNQRIFDIANLPFEHVPEDEKKQLAGNIKQTGSYRGYKLRNYWVSSDAQFAVFMLFTSSDLSAHRQRCTRSARALQL